MSKVTSITVTSDKAISGTCTINGNGTEGNKYYATASGTADADKTVTLTCSSAVNPTSEGTVFYIPVPVLTTSSTLYITVNGTAVEKDTYKNLIYTQSMKATGVKIARNTIYNITFATSLAKFSVSSTKTVNFSKGNLYWDGSTSAYHLEENQYDSPNNTGSGTYSDSHVAHFLYSKTETISRAKTYSDASATTSDVFWCNESNKISVDGTSDLYVLTEDEWSYLIGEATSSRSKDLRKYNVTVAGKPCCLVIAPDGFTGTIASSYSAEEWAIAEATYGLVCLPCAGRWNGSSFLNSGTDAFYWTATPHSDDASRAYNLNFLSSTVYTFNNSVRNIGRSVRLVK